MNQKLLAIILKEVSKGMKKELLRYVYKKMFQILLKQINFYSIIVLKFLDRLINQTNIFQNKNTSSFPIIHAIEYTPFHIEDVPLLLKGSSTEEKQPSKEIVPYKQKELSFNEEKPTEIIGKVGIIVSCAIQ